MGFGAESGPGFVSFEGRKERGSAASTAADSTGRERSGGLHSGMLVGMVYGSRPLVWIPTSLE